MAALDPTRPLTASGSLRRRQRVNRFMLWSATGAAALAVVVLGIVVYSVAERGAGALSIGFLTKDGAAFGPGGGIAEAIVGTALLIAVGTAIALPLGVLIALYLTEFAGARAARLVRMAMDLMNGLPSIVIGLFVYGLIVVPSHHQSGFAGSVALAIIMLPLIARASQEVLLLVPGALRDAAHALGISRWRTTIGIVLPNALGGIVTGTVLAVARAAGETAPLLIVCSIYSNSVTSFNVFGAAIPNIPFTIFNLSEQGTPAAHTQAWGAALVLMAFILVASLTARALLARSRAKLTR
jgi:phosphate transport system permease protein